MCESKIIETIQSSEHGMGEVGSGTAGWTGDDDGRGPRKNGVGSGEGNRGYELHLAMADSTDMLRCECELWQIRAL